VVLLRPVAFNDPGAFCGRAVVATLPVVLGPLPSECSGRLVASNHATVQSIRVDSTKPLCTLHSVYLHQLIILIFSATVKYKTYIEHAVTT
jgi:hypothetical protein